MPNLIKLLLNNKQSQRSRRGQEERGKGLNQPSIFQKIREKVRK